MLFTSFANAQKETGLGYIGSVNNSTKHEKAYMYNELVYTIYLSPARMSGYEVCPMRTPECTALCLNESGRNRYLDMKLNRINKSRIKKTQLFFENRDFFVTWVIKEIMRYQKQAKKRGYRFSVRLNNTSDISPELFRTIDNENILNWFPDVQFYDYTKVFNRSRLLKKYPNYDLTFSYDGHNMDDCIEILDRGIGRVAMVFDNVPTEYKGFKVIDGDKYDMRYLDPKGVIVGLKYKLVRNELKDDNSFVVRT
jgi:hypothetical protein